MKPPPPPKATTVGAETPEIPDSDRLPDAVAMLTYMASRHPALEKAVEPARPLLLPAQAFLAALRFMKQCWSAHEGDRPESDKEAYLRLLEVNYHRKRW